MFGIGEIVGGVVAVGGTAFGWYKKKQLANVIKEVFDVIQEYRKAKSDGEITPEEMDKLIEEIEQALKAVAKTIQL